MAPEVASAINPEPVKEIGDVASTTGATAVSREEADKGPKENGASTRPEEHKGQVSPEEKKKDQEQSEAEASDSPDDQEDDNLDIYYRVTDERQRIEDISNRKKKRDIRRRQHSRYMLLLDDRLDFLEQEVQLLKKEGIKETASEPKPSIPELKHMSWVEYLVNKGEDIPPKHYAIDLLMEEPAIFQRSSRWAGAGKVKKGSVGLDSYRVEGTTPAAFGPELTNMPERIRINSHQLCEELSRSITDGAVTYKENTPIVLRRPFKVLLFHETTIRTFTEMKEKALTETEKAQDSKNDEKLEGIGGSGSAKHHERDPPEKRLVKYLHLLLKLIEDYIKPSKDRIHSQSRIAFQDLYLLFEPGQLVYVRQSDHPQKIWRLLQITGGNRFLRQYEGWHEDEDSDFKKMKRDAFSQLILDCYFLVFDGSKFKRIYNRFKIRYFSDDQQMKNMWILPYNLAKQHDLVDETTLLSIGSQYKECTNRTKVCHRYYRGQTVDRDSQGNRLRVASDTDVERLIFPENIDGAVIVDFEKVYRYNPDWMPEFNEIGEHKHHAREFEPDSDPAHEIVQDDYTWDQRRREEYLEEEETGPKARLWEQGQLQDDDVLLLPDRVPAFVLRSRKWVYLQLGYDGNGEYRKPRLTEVKPNPEAWNYLQLPGGDTEQGHKSIIQSLVGKHFARDMELDLVRDKGRGLIVLLHGAPGVGKTSTAECVADARGKPLLPITCGDLGLQPDLVELNLSRHFELAQSWDCLLLLDEADVFLAERSMKDLQRNALVSVFLRILEYYEGILFLTTNKVGIIDEAFKSRIHMSLHYPWLTEDQTQTIWQNLIHKATSSQKNLVVNETEILIYAMSHMRTQKESPYGRGPMGDAPGWNGRQIRNAFMSAIALADYEAKKLLHDEAAIPEKVPLTKEHFKIVAKASNEFDNYLWRVHAFQSDSKRAEKGQTRFDSSQSNPPYANIDGRAGPRASFYEQPRPLTPGRQSNPPPMRPNYQVSPQPSTYGQMGTYPHTQAYGGAPQGQPYYPPAPQQQQPPQPPPQTGYAPQSNFNSTIQPPQDTQQFRPQYQAQNVDTGHQQTYQGQQAMQVPEMHQQPPSPGQVQQWPGGQA